MSFPLLDIQDISHKLGREKISQGTHGFEPWTYRTAADCSTTELYPQSILRVTEFVVCLKFVSKYKGTPTQIFYFDVLILLLFQDWEGVLRDWSFSDRKKAN